MANYLIIEIGGKQVWVEKNKYYNVNKIFASIGEALWVNRVLLISSKNKRFIGQPYLSNTKVLVEVVNHLKGPKLIVYKMKPKKKYRRINGYRHQFTQIRIKEVYA